MAMKMKAILGLGCTLALSPYAASPSYSNFNPQHFLVSGRTVSLQPGVISGVTSNQLAGATNTATLAVQALSGTGYRTWNDSNGTLILSNVYYVRYVYTNGIVATVFSNGTSNRSDRLLFPQLSQMPTNMVPASDLANSVTNFLEVNLTNTINGGGMQFVYTNTLDGKLHLLKPATMTDTQF